mgnify:CR=1 FL=1
MSLPGALVLNADFRPMSYFPLSIMSAEEAISKVYQGKLAVIAEYDLVVKAPSLQLNAPSVVMHRNYCRAAHEVRFTRMNIFIRDGFKCSYCGKSGARSDLTFDHVIPRAKGGVTSWENITTSCQDCNSRKGDKSILPSVMPFKPTIRHMNKMRGRLHREGHKSTVPIPQDWIDYLYWDVDLEK